MKAEKGMMGTSLLGWRNSRLAVFMFLSCLFMACSGPKPVKVHVLVKEQESQQSIGEVRLELFKFHKGGNLQLVDTFLTNQEGKVEVIEIHSEKGFFYKISAQKAYHEAALAGNGAAFANEAQIDLLRSDTVILYLTALQPRASSPTNNRNSTTNVNELIGSLKAGNWKGNSLPRLNWGDIDALLEVGGDTTVITSFPIKTGSTLHPDSARLGQIALWMVEAIRRDISKKGADKPVFLMPPSNVPVLGTRRGNPRLFNSKNALNKAHQAYQRWWEGRHVGDTLKTARKNPLRGTGLGWM